MCRRDWVGFASLVVALLGVGMSIAVYRFNRANQSGETDQQIYDRMMADPNKPAEDRAVAAVARLGGVVVRREDNDRFQPVIRASLRDRPVTDVDLKELSGLVNLEHLDLSGTQVTDAGLKELKGFRLLSSLDVSRTAVTGSQLADLKGLTLLATINLSGTKVTDGSLVGLAAVPQISELDLSGTAVTNAGLDRLKVLTRLSSVNLGRTRITGKAVDVLAELKLKSVDLTGIPLTVDEYLRLLTSNRPMDVEIPVPGAADEKLKIRTDGLRVTGGRPPINDEFLKILKERDQLEVMVAEAVRVFDVDLGDDPDEGDSLVRVLDLTGAPVTDAGLRHLRDYHDFAGLNVSGTAITDAGLAEVAKHPKLSSLSLDQTKVTDAGLKHLSGLTRLTTVGLKGTRVTDAGLAELKGLTRLTRLDLSGTRVTDRGLRELDGLTSLRHLNLAPKQITDQVLRAAREHGLLHRLSVAAAPRGGRATRPSEVTSLNLAESSVTDAGLAELRELTALRTLSVGFTKVSDAGVREFTRFPLTALALHGTDVTDACLDDIASVRTLRKLRIWETGITPAGGERLRAALPECNVETVRPPAADRPGDRAR